MSNTKGELYKLTCLANVVKRKCDCNFDVCKSQATDMIKTSDMTITKKNFWKELPL